MKPDSSHSADLDASSPVATEVASAMAWMASDLALVVDCDGVIRSVLS